jgi:hypothetical protein
MNVQAYKGIIPARSDPEHNFSKARKGLIKMNDKKIESKIHHAAAKGKKEFNTLVKESTVRLSKIEDQAADTAGKAKEDLADRMEINLSQLSKNFEKLLDGASSVTKDVGKSLSKANAKAQKMIHKKSDAAARRTAIYSWAAVGLALVVGFVMVVWFRPVENAAV